MKTAIRTILCAVAGVMAAVSCQKSIEPGNPAEEGKETIDICVNGLMGEYSQQDGVKSSLVNNVRVAWAAGDVVYVFDGSKYLGKLTAALDKKADGKTDEDRYAKLGGTINAPATTPCVLSLVHSSLMTEPETGAAVSELSIDMSAQSTATAPFVAYATMDYTGESISDVVVPFQFATSVIKVNCTGLKANTAIDKATLSNVNTACKLTLSGSTAPTVSGGTNGTITRTGDSYFAVGKVNGEGEAVFQIAVPVLETASEARILTVAQGSDEVKDKKFTTNSLVAATSVNTVCQLKGLPDGALPGVFTISDDGGATTKQICFSQGNLWYGKVGDAQTATFNFEANQYGFNSSYQSTYVSHFYWSKDADEAVKQDFNWEQSMSTGDVFFTNVDGFKVNVGGKEQSGWRTLSKDEWVYLINTRTVNGGQGAGKSYSLNITYGGKMGLVLYPDDYSGSTLTSGTDYTDANFPADCVFLPAAGCRDGSSVDDVGGSGYYWSSTAGDSYYAYSVFFNSNFVVSGSYDYRDYGFSVRLITESK